MGRPGPGQHSALSQSASADKSRAQSREQTVNRYRDIASTKSDLTRGELYKNSEPATILLPSARNGVSKLNRADCFCDTEESNKKAKSVFRIRPGSALQQNTMYVSPGPAPGYHVRGPLHPYQGFRPVHAPAPASWSGYQVCVSHPQLRFERHPSIFTHTVSKYALCRVS